MTDAPTTAASAETAIQANFADPDFMSAYNNRHDPAHQEKIDHMRELHRIAAGEVEPSDDKPASEPADEPVVSGEGDAEKHETEAWMESEYGVHRWQEKAELARDTARRLGGQQGIDNLVAEGHGNDMATIQLLVDLGEKDKTFPAVELVREILAKTRSPDQARLALRRRMEDADFIDAWLAKSHPRHEATVIEMRVLQELADSQTRVGAA